jgi:hypothetical protein
MSRLNYDGSDVSHDNGSERCDRCMTIQEFTVGHIEADPASPRDAFGCRQHRLHVCESNDPQRAELECFIQSAFESKHAAKVRTFMPTLLAMRNEKGGVCGVAGFRCAMHEPLFLERYLDEPIERAIQAATRREVSRSQIVEVGNLAGVNCRAAMRLVLELPRLLISRGQRWIAFTATDHVRTLLAGYGAPLIELAPARASRVSELPDDWGRYYDTDPRVMVGHLPDGVALRRRA